MSEEIGAERWREIRQIHSEHAGFYRVLRGVVLIGIGVVIGALIYRGEQAPDYSLSIFTSILGFATTALIFDELNRQRSERDYKRQLVDDAGSISNEIAKNAIHQLRRKGWLEDERKGLLKNADLSRASLSEADFTDVQLQGTNFSFANLQKTEFYAARLEGADLSYANLQEASLNGAYLQSANLQGANLQKADLSNAHMKGTNLSSVNLRKSNLTNVNLENAQIGSADLRKANLSNAKLQQTELSGSKLQEAALGGANFKGANLTDADLRGARLINDAGFIAEFDQWTILPDGNTWKWGEKLQRFTDPDYPDFWQAPNWEENDEVDIDWRAWDERHGYLSY